MHSSWCLYGPVVVYLDVLQVFENKNKSSISLGFPQTYPQSMEGIGGHQSQLLNWKYVSSEFPLNECGSKNKPVLEFK